MNVNSRNVVDFDKENYFAVNANLCYSHFVIAKEPQFCIYSMSSPSFILIFMRLKMPVWH